MKTPFQEAAAEVAEVNRRFFEVNEITPVEHRNLREAALAKALDALAEQCGVTLRKPLLVDSRGEFTLVAVNPAGSSPLLGCGKYGEQFAEMLSRNSARMGIAPGHIAAENGWCYLGHFGAEKMILEQAEAEKEKAPGNADDPVAQPVPIQKMRG